MGKNKVFILGSAGIPPRYGGFETFTNNIVGHLSEFDIYVACQKSLYNSNERITTYGNIHRFFIGFRANGIQSLAYDFFSLRRALSLSKPNDTILLLGISFGIFKPLLRFYKNRNCIIHIDGIEWERAKWNRISRLILKKAFNLSLHLANKIILDNKGLLNKIPHKYRNKACYVSYGYNHLPKQINTFPPLPNKYALAITRAEPENNLDIILEAFTELPELKLILISNAKQTKYGRQLIKKYKPHSNILLIDAIYDNIEMLQLYRENCYIYLHGHSAGGTNPSLVEAMGSKVPVIAADNNFNRITSNNLCLFFKTSGDIVENIETIKKTDLDTMKENLFQYAATNYTWEKVAANLKLVLLNN